MQRLSWGTPPGREYLLVVVIFLMSTSDLCARAEAAELSTTDSGVLGPTGDQRQRPQIGQDLDDA